MRAAETMTNGASARGLQPWSRRAATSLPTPAGPMMSTRLPVAATRFSVARTALIAVELPVRSTSRPAEARSDATSRLSRSVSVARATMSSNRSASNGFSMKSAAPRRIAATAVSRLPWPEMTSTGSVGSRRLISSSSSSPPSREPCSQTSSRTSDGRRTAIASSAPSLLAAARVS